VPSVYGDLPRIIGELVGNFARFGTDHNGPVVTSIDAFTAVAVFEQSRDDPV